MAISLLSLPLRYFLEVARTGSVNQAAQRLHVAASAVSRQLGKLEDSLGVMLFELVSGKKQWRSRATI